jgi:hypothetical protein
MKNLVASIQDRLKNFSRKEGIVLNLVLEDYANARLFARLSTSRYRDEFILKGAQLFKLWSDTPHRPTRDADFLSFGPPDPEVLKSTFEEICGVATSPPDGLEWTVGQAAPIREDNRYGGVSPVEGISPQEQPGGTGLRTNHSARFRFPPSRSALRCERITLAARNRLEPWDIIGSVTASPPGALPLNDDL